MNTWAGRGWPLRTWWIGSVIGFHTKRYRLSVYVLSTVRFTPERHAPWSAPTLAQTAVCARPWEAARCVLPEVLRRGAAAVLPQHLPDRWLDALLEEADLLAPEAWDPQEEDRVQECCAGLLGAVLVVLMEQRGHPDQLEVAVGTLMRHLHCY